MSAPEHFAADWLALREPVDHRSRAGELERALIEVLPAGPALRILDLGCGRGSNLHHLAARLGRAQHWILVDHDAALLDQALSDLPALPELSAEARCIDLGELTGLAREPIDLVTASALLDLVSADWIDMLTRCLSGWSVPALLTLSVDGRRGFIDQSGLDLADAEDAGMRTAFNRHQRVAKSLGQALGPDAAPALASALTAVGFRVRLAASDWILRAGDPSTLGLGRELLAGWAAAVRQLDELPASAIDAWQTRRLAGLEAAELGLRIGHVDLLALPGR